MGISVINTETKEKKKDQGEERVGACPGSFMSCVGRMWLGESRPGNQPNRLLKH